MLKVGDIVKIREDLSYDMEKTDIGIGITTNMLEYKGKIGTIVDIDDNDKTFKLDVDNEEWWWHEDWVEKLNKFSVGDEVVVCYKEPEGLNETLPYESLDFLTAMSNTYISIVVKYNGKIGTVVGLREDGVNVKFESKGEKVFIWMPNSWLKEFIPKFKKGDKVHIVRSGEGLTDCAGGWIPFMKEYIGDVVTIERSYNYNSGIVGYMVEENTYVWDGRLLEPVTEEEITESEYFTGKVVCINDNYRRDITKGKIYNFKNGKAVDDAGDSFPCDDPVHNVDELNDYYKECVDEINDCYKDDEKAPQFIEIIE